jgi:Tfp pilus assembly protein PilN
MIEINLLPGAKKKRGGKAGFTMPDFKAMAGAIKDPWLIACVASWAIFVIGLFVFYLPKSHHVQALEPQLKQAQREATRLKVVLKTKAETEAKRDTLLAQINIIREIDRERYIWPHILDAVTKALPAYTWLDDIASQAAADDSTGAPGAVTLQLSGKSADIQAVTRFVRNLEESPFLEGATQISTAVTSERGRDVFTYVIKVRYQRPDSTLLTMQPLAASLVQGYRSGTARPTGR